MTVAQIRWKRIEVDPTEVCLNKVLRCGQTFRWKCIDQIWSCSIKNRILLLKQDRKGIIYSSIPHMPDTASVLKEYLQLDVDVSSLYKQWCAKDKHFLKNSSHFRGIRILCQDPWENLICFICSSNNNVKRISQMCDSLCVHYGKYLGKFQNITHYTFPTPKVLAVDGTEQRLRDLGFGYRAKFIYQTAKLCVEKPTIYTTLCSKKLKLASKERCQEFLLQFPGVGPKVADCVGLMSLKKHNVVPIDTHVYQIAKRDYKFRTKSKNKTMTKNVYDEIQNFFICLWGDYAGWAHSLLFAADLRDLDNGINIDTIKDEHASAPQSEKSAQDEHYLRAIKRRKIKTEA